MNRSNTDDNKVRFVKFLSFRSCYFLLRSDPLPPSQGLKLVSCSCIQRYMLNQKRNNVKIQNPLFNGVS